MANMAYKNKFIVCVIVDGKIIKELDNGQIDIPFGSEYKIRLRNKHDRRAVCKLFIDGENVSDGGFIIEANSFVDIERPANVEKKFKFVSLDSEEAHDFGKNGPNPNKTKGTIVAEFALAYVRPETVPHAPINWRQDKLRWEWEKYRYDKLAPLTDAPYIYSSTIPPKRQPSMIKYGSFTGTCRGAAGLPLASSSKITQDGATVEGSHSNQRFNHQYFIDDGNWTTVRVFLQGYVVDRFVSSKPTQTEDMELECLEKQLEELRKEKQRREKKEKLREEIRKLEKELGR